jgi:hypothetical protein
VFTARYALSLYIEQSRFVFKELISPRPATIHSFKIYSGILALHLSHPASPSPDFSIKIRSLFSSNGPCRPMPSWWCRGLGEACINYRGPAVRKGAQGPNVLHMSWFLTGPSVRPFWAARKSVWPGPESALGSPADISHVLLSKTQTVTNNTAIFVLLKVKDFRDVTPWM